MIQKARAVANISILGMKTVMILPFFFLIGNCIDDYIKSPMRLSAQRHPIVICRSPLPASSKDLKQRLKAGSTEKMHRTLVEIAKSKPSSRTRI